MLNISLTPPATAQLQPSWRVYLRLILSKSAYVFKWTWLFLKWCWVVNCCRHGHGLGWPMGWVGLGRVRSNMIHCGTALVNISCNHEYFLILITFIVRKFSVIYELRVPFFLAELLTVFRNNFRVMFKTGPARWTQWRHKWHHGLILLVEGEFPLLAKIARHILCISTSSAQSERDISAVSRTMTDACSRLSPKTVETCNGTHSLGSAWFTA